MDRESIRRILSELLEAETGEPAPPLDDRVNLREGLNLDSVDIVGLIMQTERRFRIRLSREELETGVTVGDLLNIVESKAASPGTETPGTSA